MRTARSAIIAVMMSAGLLVSGSPAATAAPANQQWVKHEQGGLGSPGSSIEGKKRGGAQLFLNKGEPGYTLSENPSSDSLRYIYAGSGYCVWEELFVDTSPYSFSQPEWTKVDNYNHGKSLRRQLIEVQSYKVAANDSKAYQSLFRVYAC